VKKGQETMSDDPGALVKEHYEAVYRYSYRRCGSQVDAQDITQETFLKYLKSADRYENREKPLAYLFTIARNICIDRSRTNREHLVDDIVSVVDSHTEQPNSQENSHTGDMKTLIATLPQDQQEILELKYDQGFGVKEIASTLGMSRFAVSRRLTSALSSLRTLLDERQDHEQ